jgi:hypothetical protein
MSERGIPLLPRWPWVLAALAAIALVGCGDSRTVPSSGHSQRNNASEHRARKPAEAVMLRGAPYCNPDCIGLTAWNELIPDGLLRGAAIVAYASFPELRPLARAAVVRNTRILWGNLPTDVGGNYSAGDNRITISNTLRTESTAVLAAVIAHELAHVGQPSGRDAATCIENEMAAFAWQAATWARLPHANERSGMAGLLNTIEAAWRAGRLRDFVLTQRLYERNCLGRELPKY